MAATATVCYHPTHMKCHLQIVCFVRTANQWGHKKIVDFIHLLSQRNEIFKEKIKYDWPPTINCFSTCTTHHAHVLDAYINVPTDTHYFKISSTFSIRLSLSLAFSLSLTNKSCIHYMHKYTRRTHTRTRMNVNETVENQIDKHDDRTHAVRIQIQIQYEYLIMRKKLNNVF